MASESDKQPVELVTVRTFTSELEAKIAKGALEASGIDCMIATDDCGGQRPHLAFGGGIRLLVRSEDTLLASEVLRTPAEDA